MGWAALLGAPGAEAAPGLGHPVSVTGAEEEEKEQPLPMGSQAWAQCLPFLLRFCFRNTGPWQAEMYPVAWSFSPQPVVMKTITKTLTLLNGPDSLR